MNIFVLDRNYNKIGVLSNQGVNPKTPYFDDLYTQELDTGADTYYFSTLATYYTQDIIEIGNHVVFEFNNKQKMFVISSLEFEHRDGMNTIGVYAEGAGFELLEMYKKDIKIENCTYAQLLDNILAGTGWKYKVSSSLSKETRDVDYSQEKNVYALLQDSIQTFQGVELEFITDYRDGSPVKTIRAYGNGERGTFVGKRFEYGKNVKGIVKTQEVSDIKDENVIFNEGLIIIDGLRVEVTYDIDFALRSEEVTELNIGDTHYIIDNDFNPPMNIKGRIGKIEISFSDPTKNKIYIANFKKATGSDDDDLKEEDVKDIIDDYLDDKYGDGEVGPHEHSYIIDDEKYGLISNERGNLIPSFNDEQWIGLANERWEGAFIESIYADDISSTRVTSCTFQLPFDREEMLDVSEITTTSGINKQDLLEFILNDVKIYKYMYKDRKAESEEAGLSKTGTYLGILSESFMDHNSDNDDDCIWHSNVSSLVMRRIVSDTDNDGDLDDETTHKSHSYNLPALVVALIGAFQQYANGGLPFDPGVYATIDFVDEWCSNLDLADEEIWDKIRELEAGSGGSIDLSNYATITYVDSKVGYMEDYVNNSHNRLNSLIVEKTDALDERVTKLESGSDNGGSDPGDSGGSSPTFEDVTINGDLTVNGVIWGEVSCQRMEAVAGEIGMLQVGSILPYSDGTGLIEIGGSNNTVKFTSDVIFEGSVTGINGSDGGGIEDTLNTLTVKKIQGPTPEAGQYNCVEFEDAIRVTHIWGNSETGIVDFGADTYVHLHTDLDTEASITAAGNITAGSSMYTDSIFHTNCEGAYNPDDLGIKFEYKTVNNGSTSSETPQITLYAGEVYSNGDFWVPSPYRIYGSVYGSSDKSLKENIRYIDDSIKVTSDDLLEKADLHDFIVNQINLCEFNYIGDTVDKIGFIANDYEGTKVGDKIVSRHDDTLTYDVNNLLFATIGALQEEVRIKDEKIASLEARLAKIEEMLGINNN